MTSSSMLGTLFRVAVDLSNCSRARHPVHDCGLEILGYLLVRESSVQPALLLEHLESTLQLFTLKEDVAQ